MDQILDIVGSVPFVGIAVVVALLMLGLNKAGAWLWSLKKSWIRKTLKATHGLVPLLPSLFGAALGAIPLWPVPEPFAALPPNQKLWVMIILGLVAGSLWERVWKTFKQGLESKGIDLDGDDPPAVQGK